MKFSHEFIEQVRQANDIVSVISDYAGLKRRGNKFWACCPFHNEKTASFTVTAEKGLYRLSCIGRCLQVPYGQRKYFFCRSGQTLG